MRKGITLLTLILMLGGSTATAQSRSAAFNAFRQKALSNYQDFRKRILEHYADFLDGEWHEFEAIMEDDSPYSEPKPETPPMLEAGMDTLTTNMVMTCLPDPNVSEFALDGTAGLIAYGYPQTEPKAANINIPDNMGALAGPKTKVEGLAKLHFTRKDAEGKTNYELAVMRIPDPDFAFGPFPGQIKAPAPGEAGLNGAGKTEKQEAADFHFDFYGMDAFIPEIDFTIAESLSHHNETGAHWKKMAEQNGGMETARQLFGLAQQLGLNGYLTMRLTEAYVDRKFKESNDMARTSAVHFLMSNMGYDVRLVSLGDRFAVMMPFDQKTVYGMLAKTIDGRTYNLIFPEGTATPRSASLWTCSLPSDARGKTSDLRLTGLNLPMKPKEFMISRNGFTLNGVVNENIRALLHHYPQMPTGDFASSWVDQQLRDDIVAQVKAQTADMTELQALNTLLSLCHYGFEYSTDQKYHGFEKPYFFEENLIYDMNDCEDRAIFFAYLVWNALGLPCQVIQYPGHESVTIAATSPINGCYYDTDGRKYYSSDPTYIGSRIGMVMSRFQKEAPTVDKHYR